MRITLVINPIPDKRSDKCGDTHVTEANRAMHHIEQYWIMPVFHNYFPPIIVVAVSPEEQLGDLMGAYM